MDDLKFMREAIRLAEVAYKKGEVPVGAVIVKDGKILARARNKKNAKKNALYHAEILALHKAQKKIKDFRLNECTMYVTLEPCAMCSGGIMSARINRLVFGAYDETLGCAGSVVNLLDQPKFNHRVLVEGGMLEKECSKLMKDFFKELRVKKGEKRNGRSIK